MTQLPAVMDGIQVTSKDKEDGSYSLEYDSQPAQRDCPSFCDGNILNDIENTLLAFMLLNSFFAVRNPTRVVFVDDEVLMTAFSG